VPLYPGSLTREGTISEKRKKLKKYIFRKGCIEKKKVREAESVFSGSATRATVPRVADPGGDEL